MYIVIIAQNYEELKFNMQFANMQIVFLKEWKELKVTVVADK